MPKPPPGWTKRMVDEHWSYGNLVIAEEAMALKPKQDFHMRLAALAERTINHFGEIDRYDTDVFTGALRQTILMHDLLPLTDGAWLGPAKKMPTAVKALHCMGADWQWKCDRAWQKWASTFLRHPLLTPTPAPVPPRKPTAQSGYVYVLLAEGTTRIKIGRTGILPVRLETLRTASPFPLTLLRDIATDDAVKLERTLHKRYALYRVHLEWFDLSPDALEALLTEEFE